MFVTLPSPNAESVPTKTLPVVLVLTLSVVPPE